MRSIGALIGSGATNVPLPERRTITPSNTSCWSARATVARVVPKRTASSGSDGRAAPSVSRPDAISSRMNLCMRA